MYMYAEKIPELYTHKIAQISGKFGLKNAVNTPYFVYILKQYPPM